MYAIFQSGGHQYRAEAGDILDVERLAVDDGAQVDFDEVLLIGGDDDADVQIGRPHVDGARIKATVVGEVKGPKIEVLKYKRKNRYRVKTGHRQRYTRLKIDAIDA